MTQKLFSDKYEQYWSQLKPRDKVLIHSKHFFDHCSEATKRAGPMFITGMAEYCSKMLSVLQLHKNNDPTCIVRFYVNDMLYKWCDVFCHKLIIRNYKLLL